jgi:hypothetical protein
LPFAFEGQAHQFVVKAEDVPDRGPGAGKSKGRRRPSPSRCWWIR